MASRFLTITFALLAFSLISCSAKQNTAVLAGDHELYLFKVEAGIVKTYLTSPNDGEQIEVKPETLDGERYLISKQYLFDIMTELTACRNHWQNDPKD